MAIVECPHFGAKGKLEYGADRAFAGWDGDPRELDLDLDRARIGLPPSKRPEFDFGIQFGFCAACDGFVAIFYRGYLHTRYHCGQPQNLNEEQGGEESFLEIHQQHTIYPQFGSVPVISHKIPELYRCEFSEAYLVRSISPKASAALSRRLLELILKEEYQISKWNLSKKIDEFIGLDNIPEQIRGEVDAIRNIGNFAAHPLKDTNTGQIIDVEPGEAQWLLEVLEHLLDFTFVQRSIAEERRNKLNQKLQNAGKRLLKNPVEKK